MRATVLLLLALASVASAQSPAPEAGPLPMPHDRAYDSYKIYSLILADAKDAYYRVHVVPPARFLAQDTTIAPPSVEEDCKSPQAQRRRHEALHGDGPNRDTNHQRDFDEILDDLDVHCHDIVALDLIPLDFSDFPAQLITYQEVVRRVTSGITTSGITLSSLPAICGQLPSPALGSGIFRFSEVYFNIPHTMAAVFVETREDICRGQRKWLAFQLRDGQWYPFHWDIASWLW